MGTIIHNALFLLIIVLFACVTSVIGQDDVEFDTKVINGVRQREQKSNRHMRPDGSFCCPTCFAGPNCERSIDRVDPKFNVADKFVRVYHHHQKGKDHLAYNTTTYPGAPDCLCDAFRYSITSVADVINPNVDPSEIFIINEQSGAIYLNEDKLFAPYDMYDVTVKVENVKTGVSDTVKLTIANGDRQRLNQYSPFEMNGYEEADAPHLLSRHKRAYTPVGETTFTLTEITSVTEIRVGTRVKFQLQIEFPTTDVDIQVELFTPDNETTVMILCTVDVDVASAVNLNTSYTGPSDVIFTSRNGNSHQPDMATIDFGTVKNLAAPSAAADNTITITYEAVMIENYNTQNTTYYVSAGAEYLSENYIWVGQASFEAVVDGNMTVGSDPIFNVTMPTSLALGSTSLALVEMYIPYPTRNYVFKVFSPPATVGLVSICAVMFDSFGENFACGNDKNQITPSLEADPQANGNAVGVLDLGVLLNKGARDDAPVVADNKVAVKFLMHLYPDTTKIGFQESIGLAVEVDSSIMWIGNYNFGITDVDPAVPVTPAFESVASSLTGWSATQEEPFSITYNITVPQSTTASHFSFEMLAPVDGANMPIFSVCSFKVTYVGADMPCHNKDELVTEFLTRDTTGTSTEPDRAVIDFGYVTNLGLGEGAPGADRITLEAVLRPLQDMTTLTSGYSVTFGVSVQGGSVVSIQDQVVTVDNAANVAPITNLTQPVFSMEYYDNDDQVEVMSSTKMLVDMSTYHDTLYDEMHMEFLLPYGVDDSLFHICRVDIVRNGKNMPCMTPEWHSRHMQYTSQFGTYLKDRAKLNLGGMCNVGFENDVEEDKTQFAVYLKVLDAPENTHMSLHYMSAGLLYTSTSLWVGALKLDVIRNAVVSPTKSSYGYLTNNSTVGSVPLGNSYVYSVMLKIGRGDRAHVKANITSTSPNVHICTVRAFSAGLNYPCFADEVSVRTADYWADGTGYQSVKTDFGIITNYGDPATNMTANSFYDHDTMMMQIILRAAPGSTPGTYGLDFRIFVDTNEMSALLWQPTITTTADMSGVSQLVPVSVIMNMTFGEIAGNDSSPDVAIGEVRKIVATLEIPEGSNYKTEFSFLIPLANVGKLEICDAVVESVGDNLPCVNPNTEANLTSVDGNFTDTATFSLDYVCSHVLRPGDQKANTITFAAYVRVVPNGLAVIGENLDVQTNLLLFDSPTSVDSITLTVADPANFEDKVKSLDGVSNDTLITLDALNPLPLTIGQNVTINISVSVPPYSSSKFLFDVSLPTDDSACMTVRDVRVIGASGRNVLCVDPTINNKNVTYTPVFNDSLGTGQNNYLYLDLGIITNTGITYMKEKNMSTDDQVVLEVDLQMADCGLNTAGATQKISVGNKVANYIFIYDHDVTVTRDTNEKPDIVFSTSVNVSASSTTVFLDGLVYHNYTSTAEAHNTTIAIHWPVYMSPSYTFLNTSGKPCAITPVPEDPSVLEIFCDDFYFGDVFTFTVQADVNNSLSMPSGYSSANSIAVCEVKADMRSDQPSAYSADAWYPYGSFDGHTVDFSVSLMSTSCGSALGMASGAIADCQIRGSPDDISPATNARLNMSASAVWVPYIRSGDHAKTRHITVMFGNLTKVTRIEVQQDIIAYTDMANEITVEYTNDGVAWFGSETLQLPATPSTLESVSTSGISARGVRISVTNDTKVNNQAKVGVKFELYGCVQAADKTQADACAMAAQQDVTRPVDFTTRSYLVGMGETVAFVCDRAVDSKEWQGQCHGTVDSGARWSRMDSRLAVLIGFEATENRVYGYADDLVTILVTTDNGATWQSTDNAMLAASKLLTWTTPVPLPEIDDANLQQATPHINYSYMTWGATAEGVFKSGAIVLKWN